MLALGGRILVNNVVRLLLVSVLTLCVNSARLIIQLSRACQLHFYLAMLIVTTINNFCLQTASVTVLF
jgi:hypothetical protein